MWGGSGSSAAAGPVLSCGDGALPNRAGSVELATPEAVGTGRFCQKVLDGGDDLIPFSPPVSKAEGLRWLGGCTAHTCTAEGYPA